MRLGSWAVLLAVVAVAGCESKPDRPPGTLPASLPGELPGLHNVRRVSDKLMSGSAPEGDDGFQSLHTLGVRTVITVDGARPEVEHARRYGMRYVHLPVGYDGVPREQALRIARAVRDLPGPIYLHCHHGKHRAPASAAAARLCLDPACKTDDVVAFLRGAGTDPKYAGLYAVQGMARPTDAELDAVPADFPEVATVPDFVRLMSDIDERWTHLIAVRAAGWKAPPAHPDVDPPHEALMLVENYKEAARVPTTAGRTDEFRRWLADAEADATRLEQALRTPGDKAAADKAFAAAAAACTRCHAKYRDVPHD